MELRHLRYFVAVAEAENVSRAALKLHVSQPALSRQIRDLEAELGFPLLERTAKSVRLTDVGRAFLTESRAVLQRADEAVRAARAIAAGGRGELHLGYAPSPTARILPPTLRAFQGTLPSVRVKLHDLSTEEMLAGLREGKLQIALLVRPTPAMLRGCQFEALLRDPLRLAVPPDHPFARLRSIPLARAATEPWVALSRADYPEYHEFLAALFSTTKAKPRIVQEYESAASLVSAIESGRGLAMAPQTLACSFGPRLKLIPFSPEPEPMVIGAVWLKAGLSADAKRLLGCAKEVAGSAK
ncbi:MAG: LysR substrate-binding domain-containing protein [Verrucomicrobia bacterium]|nr:LysR substrate-binding domain-containing protein [Verrucomicrobiota bacterium]